MPGGSPKFNTPDGGRPACPVCGLLIRYQDRHRHNGVWKHSRCSDEEPTLKHLLASLDELEFADGDPGREHGLAILACMNVDGSDFKKASELSRLDPAFIAQAMQPLIDQGVFKDGKWCMDSDVDLENSQHCAIQIILWVLCSQGKVVRIADRPGPGVPDGGGGDPNV